MSTELSNGVIIPEEYSDDWYDEMSINLRKLNDVIGSDSEKLNADGVDFLRMSSAALTDGGTGNFSDLNSSYKIKTGDLVLDSGRKLYQIVSVDSTNETFTVGNYLFKVTAESDLAPVAESGDYDDLDNKPDLNPYDQHIANTDIHVTTSDKTTWNAVSSKANDSDVVHKTGVETINGNKTFASINGVEPGSLSLPSDNSSNVVDISSYITYFDGTLNRYVPPANGWIGIYVNNCTEIYMKIDNLWGKNVCRSNAGKLVLLMPVPKGKGVDIQIFATGTLRYARFIPCQGNV